MKIKGCTTFRWFVACAGLVRLLVAEETAVNPGLRSRGEELARVHCAVCHEFTSPELLPKRSWHFLLTYMGLRMGIDETSLHDTDSPAERRVIAARKEMLSQTGLLPPAPILPLSDWAEIRRYYQDEAPAVSIPPLGKPAVRRRLPLFRVKPHFHYERGAVTSLVKILPRERQVLVGDSRREILSLWDSDLRTLVEYDARDAMWVDAEVVPEGVYLLLIGDLAGDYVDRRLGRVLWAARAENRLVPRGVALPDLYRPADLVQGDLDGDGIPELVVTSFGIETGTVAVHRRGEEPGQLRREPAAVLHEGPGAVQSVIHDFNGDGRNDVAVLVSDAREGIWLFLNQGDFQFEARQVVTAHAAFGFVRLLLQDVDGDGRMDLITANGDNVDSDPYNTLKAYHGVRVYLHQGDSSFVQGFHYPLQGAYGVEAEDFDGDGDIDLAAIAFNPDFGADYPETFVFLEQVNAMVFVPRTLPEIEEGRWLAMDAGDLDGDGDRDLILGGGYVPAGLLPDHPEVWQRHLASGPPVLVLENQSIR